MRSSIMLLAALVSTLVAPSAAMRRAPRGLLDAPRGAYAAARLIAALRRAAHTARPRRNGAAVRLSAEARPPAPLTRDYRGVTDRSKPKRKVCLHVGFLGSNYYGMQLQKTGVPTIESELISALLRGGFVSAENAETPSKFGWQRASRTDKGVHAIGATVSCKLLLSDAQLEEVPIAEGALSGFFDGGALGAGFAGGEGAAAPGGPGTITVVTVEHLAALNALLPDDITVACIQRTRGGFDAYEHCSARRYVYLLPEAALGPGGPSAFSATLRKFAGTHAFHNFASGLRAPREREAELAALLPGVELGWPLAVHPLRPRSESFRSVLRCELAPEPLELGAGLGRYYMVEVQGRSFVLHQIRHMIGGALAVANGLVPPEVFDAALGSPFMVDVAPLAPGEGLALLGNDFFNEKTKTTDVHLTAPALAAMRAFFAGQLAPHIHGLYYAPAGGECAGELELAQPDGAGDAAADVAQSAGQLTPGRRTPFQGWDWWLSYLRSGQWLEEEQASRWDELLAAVGRWEAALERQRAKSEERRRSRSAAEGKTGADGARAPPGGGVARERVRERLLPRGLQTAVAVAFQMLPGPELEGLMARLLAAVESNELPPMQQPDLYVSFLRAEREQAAAAERA